MFPTRLTDSEIYRFLKDLGYIPRTSVDDKAWLVMKRATGEQMIIHVMTEDEFAVASKIKVADTDAMRIHEMVLCPGKKDLPRLILTERHYIGKAPELALISIDPIKAYRNEES